MKKLMFAAVAAAMIGGVEAAGYVDCFGVYDFNASLKTTKGVRADIKAKSNPCLEENVTAFVRKQTTVKVAGIIWGCDCDFTAEPRPFTGWNVAYDGSAFWNATDKTSYDVYGDEDYNKLDWTILNRIDTTAKKTEGFWTLTLAAWDDDAETTEFELQGAGFGTAAGDVEANCPRGLSHVYIPSMSGYAVGTRNYTCLGDKDVWTVCQDDPVHTEYELIWWQLCDCGEDEDALTIAYGSWTLKFNQTVANKVAKTVSKGKGFYYEPIRDKCPAYVRATLDAYNADPTECDVLKAAVDKAETGVADAEAAVEAVKYENLKKAEAKAAAELAAAEAAKTAADTAYDNASAAYDIAKAAYSNQVDYVTTNTWTVSYLNASQQPATANGTGLVKFDECIEELKLFTFTEIKYAGDGIVATYANAKAFVSTQNTKTANLKAGVETTKEASATAAANVVTAKANLVKAQDAYTAAQNDLANINLLQYKAAQDLEKAETALTAAQVAYAAAGCAD